MDYHLPQHLVPDVGSIQSILVPTLSEPRRRRLMAGLAVRSRSVLCVFESTHHSHNISAVLRTIDAMGFLEAVFVYHNPQMRFRARDSVERGAAQWLVPRRTTSIAETGQALRDKGYRVLLVSRPDFALTADTHDAALPHHDVGQPDTLEKLAREEPFRPVALVFGSELQGVHPDWLGFADGYLSVAMHGFVESLNLSVCAGIILHALRGGLPRLLSPFESTIIGDYWLARATSGSRRIVLASNPSLDEYFGFVSAGRFFNLVK